MIIIQKDIKEYGGTDHCPGWHNDNQRIPKSYEACDCRVCKAIFPRVTIGQGRFGPSCPCGEYTAKYLLRKIDQILRGEIEI